jgi:hypothetical protein
MGSGGGATAPPCGMRQRSAARPDRPTEPAVCRGRCTTRREQTWRMQRGTDTRGEDHAFRNGPAARARARAGIGIYGLGLFAPAVLVDEVLQRPEDLPPRTPHGRFAGT